MAFGSSASCATISASSTWNREPCNPSTTPSGRGCHPCLRYDLSPMCPGRTVGLLSCLIRARQTGQGCDVDACLFDVAMHQMSYTATWHLNHGHVTDRERRSGHFSVAPVQTFPTADGWIFVMCMTEKFWRNLLEAMQRTDLADDPRFSTMANRQANRDVLSDLLDVEFRKRSTGTWLERLAGLLPVAPVNDMEK